MASIFESGLELAQDSIRDNMEEEWKPVDEVPEYLVSNFGRVKGRRGALMSLITNACGYKTASLFVNKKTRYRQVHRLVALAFIPNPNNLPYVNHIDGDKLNNHVNNLEWVTAKENAEKTVHPAVENVRRSRKVVQLSLSKDYIKTWNSITQAADELKLDPILITNACKNADCVQDWRWLFHEDYVEPYADELWETIEVDKVSYTVSSHGRIRLANGQIVVGGQKGKYYRYKSHAVHRLVALAFCADQRGEGCNTVAHKDGNALNNKASNLEWTTHRDSCKHAHTIGLCRRRPVRRFLPNGTVIEYETVKAASAASGVASSDIVGACRGKKQRPGGSRWEYIEVNTTDEKEAENPQKPEDPKGPVPGPEKNSPEPEMTEAELEALFWKLLGFDEQTDTK